MNGPRFSVGDALTFGWNTTFSNIGYLLLYQLLILAVGYLPLIIIMSIAGVSAGLAGEDAAGVMVPVIFIVYLALLLWIYIVYMGFIRVTIKMVDGIRAEFGEFASCAPLILKFIASGILFAFATTIGSILLIIPGIYLMVKLWFFDYYIIDQNAGAMEALQRSFRDTTGSGWSIFGLLILAYLINMIGAFLCGIGMFFTIPITLLSFAYAYRNLASAPPERMSDHTEYASV